MENLVFLIPGLGVPVYLWLWIRWELDSPLKHVPSARLVGGTMTLDSDTIGLT